jgi:hypothetical protein
VQLHVGQSSRTVKVVTPLTIRSECYLLKKKLGPHGYNRAWPFFLDRTTSLLRPQFEPQNASNTIK